MLQDALSVAAVVTHDGDRGCFVKHEVGQSWLTIALYCPAQNDSCHVVLHPWINAFVSEDCALSREVMRHFVCLEIVFLSTDDK
jgi:hypothetical protein